MNRPADHAQRLQALDIGGSYVVQAPAGSGKTELLIRRYLSLLGVVEQPEQVLAITFTRKAAAEMRSRVIEQLRLAQQPPPDDVFQAEGWQLGRRALEQNNQLEWGLLEQPMRLRIQTIDAFSQGLAQALPLLAGSGVQLVPAADPEVLYQEAARELLEGLDNDSPCADQLMVLLRHLDNRRGQLELLLVQMLARRDQWLKLLPAPNDFGAFRSQMETLLERVAADTLKRWVRALPAEWFRQLNELVDYAADNLRAEAAAMADTDKAATLMAKAARLARPSEAHPEDVQLAGPGMVSYWQGVTSLLLTGTGVRKSLTKNDGFPPGKGAPADRKALMGELLDQLRDDDTTVAILRQIQLLPAPQLSDEDARLIEATVVVLHYAAAELMLTFQRHGEGDFAEQSLRALQALSDEQGPTDMALALDYRLQHILVDEFQDTSWLQHRLLELLTSGWQSDDGRSLFLVGDPMQSIYRFREADVGLFLRAQEFPIGQLPLTPLTLTANFRSDEGLVEANNRLFSELFPARQDIRRGAVGFVPSTATRRGDAESSIYCHGLVGEQARDQEAVALLKQLQAVQGLADDATETAASADAILVRGRSHLVELLPLLRSAGVAFQAVELQKLADSSALLDLLAITRALLHPADRVAWIALLHGPCVGVGLADLTRLLAGAPRERSLLTLLGDQRLVTSLSSDGQQRLADFLVRYRAITDRAGEPLARQVEGLWLALAGPALLDDEAGLADADRYLQILDQAARRLSLLNPERLTLLIDREFASPGSSTGQPAGQGLQIMTMHKAKGLQFDRVFIPGLDRGGRSDDTPLLAWEEHSSPDAAGHLLLAPIRSAYDEHHPIYQWIRSLEKERDEHEQMRLLYVALTRARYQVHLFAGLKTDADGEIAAPKSNSLLSRLWPALERAFVSSIREVPSTDLDTRVDEPKPAWRRRIIGAVLPDQPASLRLAPQVTSDQPEAAIEFDWAGDSARIIGLLVHRHLCRLSLMQSADWSAYLVGQQGSLADQLRQYGLPERDVEKSVDAVREALQNSLSDSRGQWLLSGGRDNQSEYALSRMVEGRLSRLVIDRTFIDEDGVRWIIDYKTGYRSGGDVDGFLDQERLRYTPQLEDYARLISLMSDEPVRLGLYFPRMVGWREWPWQAGD